MQVSEAVSYLRSAGHWSIALWLARYNACFFSSSELYLPGSDCLRKTSTHSLPSIVISSPTKVTLKLNLACLQTLQNLRSCEGGLQDPSAVWEKSSCYRDPASSSGALLEIPFFSTLTLELPGEGSCNATPPIA